MCSWVVLDRWGGRLPVCRLLTIVLFSSLLKTPEFCLDRGVNPLLWLLSPVAWPCGAAKPGEGGPSTNMVKF